MSNTETKIALDACEAACDTLRETAQQLWKKLDTVVNGGGNESYLTIEAAKELLNNTKHLLNSNQ
jgi:coproporphyrinogen III oxidase-like Fe-S oxidoreductase